jgi:hypothetical protein
MMQANTLLTLRLAVSSWAFMGLIGIPCFVFFDLFHGWKWEPYNPIYDEMIVSIYLAVGACSLAAVRDPLKHASFLWFVVWSSLTHGGVMIFHALREPMHNGHLIGDVWILVGAIGLALPLWRAQNAT